MKKKMKPSVRSAKSPADDCGCPAESSFGEPLVAIVATTREVPKGSIRSVRVEKASASGEGFAFETMGEVEVEEGFHTACEKGKACLPWVSVTRDTKRFEACFNAAKTKGRIESSDQLFLLIRESMAREDQEVFYVVMVDTQMFVRGIGELARGARDRVAVSIPDVLRLPIVDGASGFFIAHNHPSGHPLPSEADKELTKSIRKAANTVGLQMLDHLVVGVDSYYSFEDGKVHKPKRPAVRKKRA